MILDYNIFEELKGNQDMPDKLFYVLEQQPHKILFGDFSKYLYDKSYFGSYNRAFLEGTKEDLNIEMLDDVYKTKIFETGGRGGIMKHFSDDVKDLESIKNLLRYNGHKQEFEGEAISPRGGSFGGTDTKVTNSELVKNVSAVAIAGPTMDNPFLEPFEFTDSYHADLRLGVPNKFDFEYLLMSPANIWCDKNDDVYNFDTNSLDIFYPKKN